MKTSIFKFLLTIAAALILQSKAIATPALTIMGIHTAGSSGNGITPGALAYGQTSVVFYGFPLTCTTAATGLNSIRLTGGTTVANYFTCLKLHSGTTNNYTAGTLTPVGPAIAGVSCVITPINTDPAIRRLTPATNRHKTFSTAAHTGSPTFYGQVASGQGSFIKALNGSAAFTFNKSCKISSSQLTGGALFIGVTAQQGASKLLRLKLFADSTNYDDIVIGFKATATAKFNGYEDAKDLGGMGAIEGLTSFSADSIPVPLAINFLPLPGQKQTIIHLGVQAKTSRQFTLQRVALDTLPKIYEIWLMDKYMKDSLDLRNNNSYIFNVHLSDTASYGNNRFSIVIRQNNALGIHLLDFTATKTSDGVLAAWKSENEESYTNFTVQRSTDNGVTYDVLGGFASNEQGSYNFTDKNPARAVNLYRLKIEDLNGTISYSEAIPLTFGDGTTTASGNISVYPNPAVGTINLAIKPDTRANLLSGVQSINKTQGFQQQTSGQSYAIKIVSINGRVVKSAMSSQPNWQDDVGSLMPGTYVIQVVNNTDKSLVGRTTFIKM